MLIRLNDNEEIARRYAFDPDTVDKWSTRTPFNRYDSRFEQQRVKPKFSYPLIRRPNCDGVEAIHDGLLWMYSDAYSQHRPVVFAPHDAWHIVLTELASVIKTNADACRSLFTRSDTKIEILIPGFEQLDLVAVMGELRDLVPVDTGIFLPEFSTHTEGSRMAALAAFCDAVQNFYSYGTFMCGLPAVKVTGTDTDWAMIENHAGLLGKMFGDIGLGKVQDWLSAVQARVRMIRNTLAGGDQTDWINFFSQKNIGSGGEKKINGWITEFWFQQPDNPKLENFNYTWAIVPYKNVETQREFRGVYGPFLARRDADGFVYSDYAEVIFEKVAKTTTEQ
jgi:hypothetical protein